MTIHVRPRHPLLRPRARRLARRRRAGGHGRRLRLQLQAGVRLQPGQPELLRSCSRAISPASTTGGRTPRPRRQADVDFDRPVAGIHRDPADRHTLVLRFVDAVPADDLQPGEQSSCSPGEPGDGRALGRSGSQAPGRHRARTRWPRTCGSSGWSLHGQPDLPRPARRRRRGRRGRGRPLPHVKRVQLDYFERRPCPPWLLFQQGLFDVGGHSQGRLQPGDRHRRRPDAGDVGQGHRPQEVPVPGHDYIGFNMNPTRCWERTGRCGRRCRWRSTAATYIAKFLNGRGVPAIGPIPPGFPTYDAKRVNPYTQFDLEKGRPQANGRGGQDQRRPDPAAEHPVPRRPTRPSGRWPSSYVDQMGQIGHDPRARVPRLRPLAGDGRQPPDPAVRRRVGGDYPDEQDFSSCSTAPTPPPGGSTARLYVNPAFDKLYDQGRRPCRSRRSGGRCTCRCSGSVEDDCPWLIGELPARVRPVRLGRQPLHDGLRPRVRAVRGRSTKPAAVGAAPSTHTRLKHSRCCAYLVRKLVLTAVDRARRRRCSRSSCSTSAKDPARAFAGKVTSPAQLQAIRTRWGMLDKPRFASTRPTTPDGALVVAAGHAVLQRAGVPVPAVHAVPGVGLVAVRPQGPGVAGDPGAGVRDRAGVAVHGRSPCSSPPGGTRSTVDYAATGLAVLLDERAGAEHLHRRAVAVRGRSWPWFPVAGWAPGFLYAIHFAALPILVSVVGGLGGQRAVLPHGGPGGDRHRLRPHGPRQGRRPGRRAARPRVPQPADPGRDQHGRGPAVPCSPGRCCWSGCSRSPASAACWSSRSTQAHDRSVVMAEVYLTAHRLRGHVVRDRRLLHAGRPAGDAPM